MAGNGIEVPRNTQFKRERSQSTLPEPSNNTLKIRSSKLWVKYGRSEAIGICADGCKDVDDFIRVIIDTMQLNDPPQSISLFIDGESKPLDRKLFITELLKIDDINMKSLTIKGISVSVSMQTDVRFMDKYMEYMEVADRLIGDKQFKIICKELKEIKTGRMGTFAYLAGSQGAGKTQLAMTLLRQSTTPVFYFNCRLNSYFSNVSRSLLDCAQRDYERLSSQVYIFSDKFGCSRLERENLFLYGFLCFLLESFAETEETEIYERSVKDVLDVIKKKSIHPLIILDEFHSDEFMRFLCNAIKCAEFRLLVLSATDSTLIGMSRLERNSITMSRVDVIPWCRIIFKLPQFIPPPTVADTFLLKFFSTSRPLFSKLALDYTNANNTISNANDLLKLAQYIGNKVMSVKGIRETFGGRKGQIAMFQSATIRSDEPSMVHQHFAVFDVDRDALLVDARMNIVSSEILQTCKWKPCNRLPGPKEDLLLHLCLSGIPNVHAIFNTNGLDASLFEAIQSLNTNSNSNNSSGRMMTEMLAAVCKASHVQGFSGCSVEAFVKQLFFELTNLKVNIPDNQFNTDCRIPFMSQPDTEWPEWLSELSGTLLGDLSQTTTDDRISFKCLPNGSSKEALRVTGECCASELDCIPDIELIMERIPNDSHLHLVITNGFKCSDISADSALAECWYLSATDGLQMPVEGYASRTIVLFIETNLVTDKLT